MEEVEREIDCFKRRKALEKPRQCVRVAALRKNESAI